jgi:hypothetical protein
MQLFGRLCWVACIEDRQGCEQDARLLLNVLRASYCVVRIAYVIDLACIIPRPLSLIYHRTHLTYHRTRHRTRAFACFILYSKFQSYFTTKH